MRCDYYALTAGGVAIGAQAFNEVGKLSVSAMLSPRSTSGYSTITGHADLMCFGLRSEVRSCLFTLL